MRTEPINDHEPDHYEESFCDATIPGWLHPVGVAGGDRHYHNGCLGSRAQQARLDSGAARLDALVRHARTRAVIERRDVALSPSADGRWVRLTYPGGGGTVRTPPLDLGATVRLRLAQGSDVGEQADIIFHADGTADHVGLLLSSHAGVRRMVLDPARARLVTGGS